MPPSLVSSAAREAELLGYDSFWVTHPPGHDGIAALAPAARATTTITLGLGVVPLHARPAGEIVEAVSVHDLPVGRLLLGVGSEPPGSLERMRDGVALIRERLPCEVVVAALGPRMCRLAGELADGVLLNWLTPRHAQLSGEWIGDGAAAAGHERPTVHAYVRLAVGADAKRRLEAEAVAYTGARSYAEHFERMDIEQTEAALAASTASTAIAVEEAGEVAGRLEDWNGAVDSVVFRVVPGSDDLDVCLDIVRAGAP
jgi:alkanesulfonate monooxygenase SsuD/methylene tetrahydromethanopterin reductase-like flavin-dependent oxidoreductase (luciferase family)